MCIKCYWSNVTFLIAKKKKSYFKINRAFHTHAKKYCLKKSFTVCYINMPRPYLIMVHFRWKNVYFIFNIMYRVILKSWDKFLEEVGCIRKIQNYIGTHVSEHHFNPLRTMCFRGVLALSSAYYHCSWMLHCLTER